LLGPELAAVHGAFGQVVFTLFVTVAILAAPRSDGDCLAEDERRRLRLWSIALPVSVFVQLVWAVWLRHLGSPLAQRLHILTAFVVTGLAVVLINQILSRSSTRQPLGFLAYHLLGLIALQLLLGVESWMEKFAAAGPHASVPPELRPIEVSGAVLRTAHAVIGAALLAASVALALRIGRLPISRDSDLVATVSGNLNQLHTDLEYAAVGTDNSAPRTV